MRKEGLPVIIGAIEMEDGRLMVGDRSADEGERVLRADPSILRYGLHYVSAYPLGRLTAS